MYKLYTREDGVACLEIASQTDLLTYVRRTYGGSLHYDRFTFKGVVKISDGVLTVRKLFEGCSRFNSPVILPYGLVSTEGLFAGCTEFNFPVQLPESILNCAEMFRGCKRFNQPVVIPYGTQNCKRMFRMCETFNHPLVIPRTVNTDIGIFEMLYGCRSMHSPIIFHNDVDVADIRSCMGELGKEIPELVIAPTFSLADEICPVRDSVRNKLIQCEIN